MKISHEEIREILSIVEGSSFDTIEIKVGDIHIAASKTRTLSAAKPAPAASEVAPPRAAVAPTENRTNPAPAPKQPSRAAEKNGLVEITAPIVGTFYVASEPGAAPFVKPGDMIEPESTVGIIEVMKVFNDVRAEVKGEVVECLVQDGDLVEFKQPIFLIRPEA